MKKVIYLFFLMPFLADAQTTNYVPKWNGSAYVNTVTPIFEDATNLRIGIGTTGPEQILHAHGQILSTSSVAGFLFRDRGGVVTDQWAWYSTSNIARFWRQGVGDLIGITNGGNVGIGTTAPASMLSVGAFNQYQVNSSGNIVKLNNVATSFPSAQGAASTFLRNDGSGNLSWAAVSGSAWSLTGNAGTVDGTNFIGTTDNVPFNIRVNNQKAGRIDNTLANTFFGYQSGNANTTGYNNTASGDSALFSNTTGNGNTAIGASALFSNTIGAGNTASGYLALFSNTSGTSNTAIGLRALYSNTSGTGNTASGYVALSLNTTGTDNIANGFYSLYKNSTGFRNAASGYGALLNNTTGYDNTGYGNQTLYGNSTGISNTAIGSFAGFTSIVNYLNQCTFVGAWSYPSVARTNVTMLGYGIANAQISDDNEMAIGNTAITAIRGQVGFTTYSDARFKLNVKDDIKGLDFIMKLKPVTYNEDPTILHRIWGTPDSIVSKIDHSDIKKLRFIGFLAQDVEKAARESGFNFPGIDVPRNEKEVYSLRYTDFIMPMVKAMQEQQKLIQEQQKQIDDLKKLVFAGSNNISDGDLAAGAIHNQDVMLNSGVIILDQNNPNPFKETTTINYSIPEYINFAQIIFSDHTGRIINTVDISHTGEGQLNVKAEKLSSGMYSYSIVIDGKVIDTKKMIKTK